MANIIAGDNGTLLEITLSDDAGFVDLTTATSIVANFVRGNKSTFSKSLAVVNAAAGACETTLTSEDVGVAGGYTFQVTAAFSDTSEFSSGEHTFFVSRLLRGN